MAFSALAALSLLTAASSAKPIQPSEVWSLNRTALLARDSGSCGGTYGQEPTKTYGDFTGCTSQYEDGSGTYIRSDDEFHYGPWEIGGDKCWTDLFHIGEESVTHDKYPLQNSCINCATSSTCSVIKTDSQQLCTTNSWEAGGDISFSIIKDIFSVSASVSHTWSTEKCSSTSVQVDCEWDDMLWHAVSLQAYYTRIHGYIRRRCNFDGDGKGDMTVWSHDYTVDVPTGDIHTGCNAVCDSSDKYDLDPPATTTTTSSTTTSSATTTTTPPPDSTTSSTTSAPPATTTTDTPSCSWEGHCLGASCSSGDDCSDDLVCNNGSCAPPY